MNEDERKGRTSCNSFTSTYSQQNGFTITLGASTATFGGEASLDQQYLNLLSNVAARGPDGAGDLVVETAGVARRMFFMNNGTTL